ncbi:hypothetical protein Ndes2437B_g06174 [Nannochloris sp. 'desiccata']
MLATGAAVAARGIAAGKAHAAPFFNGRHPLVASLSASAGCNAATCTDPNCPVHRPKWTPPPQDDPQSLKVASEGGFSWTECIPAFGSIIAAGSGVVALLYCAWTLQIAEPNDVGGGMNKVNINKIVTGAILGFVPSVGGAVGFVDSRAKSRTSKVGKDLEKKMDSNKIDLEKKMDSNKIDLEKKMDSNKIDLEKKMDSNKIDLEKKMDSNEKKMDKMMEMLIALGQDIAFIKGADSKKK